MSEPGTTSGWSPVYSGLCRALWKCGLRMGMLASGKAVIAPPSHRACSTESCVSPAPAPHPALVQPFTESFWLSPATEQGRSSRQGHRKAPPFVLPCWLASWASDSDTTQLRAKPTTLDSGACLVLPLGPKKTDTAEAREMERKRQESLPTGRRWGHNSSALGSSISSCTWASGRREQEPCARTGSGVEDTCQARPQALFPRAHSDTRGLPQVMAS